jgi:hypothetical protein
MKTLNIKIAKALNALCITEKGRISLTFCLLCYGLLCGELLLVVAGLVTKHIDDFLYYRRPVSQDLNKETRDELESLRSQVNALAMRSGIAPK